MKDLILDTVTLVEMLVQYYGSFHEKEVFYETRNLNLETVKVINNIIECNKYSSFVSVIASSFAFVEIARKFDTIFVGRVTIAQFASFIEQPPDWFWIAPVDKDLFTYLMQIPSFITISNDVYPIEWADAIHLATAMSRDNWLFATTDRKLKNIPIFMSNII